MFFAQPKIVAIYCENSDVLIADYTYKTNVYGIPLLYFASVTSINTTVPLAYVFIYGKTKEDYD